MTALIVVSPYDVDDGRYCRKRGCDFRAKDSRGRSKHEAVHAEEDPTFLGGYANRTALSRAKDVTPKADREMPR